MSTNTLSSIVCAAKRRPISDELRRLLSDAVAEAGGAIEVHNFRVFTVKRWLLFGEEVLCISQMGRRLDLDAMGPGQLAWLEASAGLREAPTPPRRPPAKTIKDGRPS